jgi:hypothetical protein
MRTVTSQDGTSIAFDHCSYPSDGGWSRPGLAAQCCQSHCTSYPQRAASPPGRPDAWSSPGNDRSGAGGVLQPLILRNISRDAMNRPTAIPKKLGSINLGSLGFPVVGARCGGVFPAEPEKHPHLSPVSQRFLETFNLRLIGFGL